MDVTADLVAPCTPGRLFRWVSDLGSYPRWLDIVPRAVPADAAEGDLGPAWMVDLRARVGPLARSKRLRMVTTLIQPPDRVGFDRRETDGRDHSDWSLRASVARAGDGSKLTMHLHYGGSLLGPVGERLLRDEINRSRPRLLALVATDP